MTNKNESPVSEQQELELECVNIGKKGDGIFRYQNFVIVVPNTKAGETYKIRVTKVLPKIAFGEVCGKPESD